MRPEPTFFLDRSLGGKIVARALRDDGWNLVTMDEQYGVDGGELIDDVTWITEATELGFVLLTKDTAIARRPIEAQTVYTTSACVFALADGNLTGPAGAARFLSNRDAIFRWASRGNGPFVAGVTASGLRRVRLQYP